MADRGPAVCPSRKPSSTDGTNFKSATGLLEQSLCTLGEAKCAFQEEVPCKRDF
ncbi:MAG: hypothetical protein RI973_2406 [Bacteroidota bacterium]